MTSLSVPLLAGSVQTGQNRAISWDTRMWHRVPLPNTETGTSCD